MLKNINAEEFIVIPRFVRTRLNLSGTDLLVYSIIYGFNRSTHEEFRGSINYLADWTGLCRQTIVNSEKKLVSMGLLTKRETYSNKNKQCFYVANMGDEIFEVQDEYGSSGQKTLLLVKIFDYPSQEYRLVPSQNNRQDNIVLDNIDNNIERNTHLDKLTDNQKSHEHSECGRREKENLANASSEQKKKRRLPTSQEVQDYARGKDRPDQAELFFNYYSARGWKGIESWQFAFDTWLLRDNTNGERKPLKSPENSERKRDKEYEDYLRTIREI